MNLVNKISNHAITKVVVRLLIFVLNRLILILSIPLILINVLCAMLVFIKNWSIINTQELDV